MARIRSFIVFRKPKQRYTDVYKSCVIAVGAESKAMALREAERMAPDHFPNASTELYRKPEAQVLEHDRTYLV